MLGAPRTSPTMLDGQDTEVEVKEAVTRFQWEPKGNRLCALHGEPNKVSCSLFDVQKGKVTLMVTIPDLRSIDCIFWSPAGRYCVLAQLYNLQNVSLFNLINLLI